MYYYSDPTFLLIIPALIFSIYAQWKVHSTFKKYSKVPSGRGLTGAQAAEMILKKEGVFHVPVQKAEGLLSDHYDPFKKVLKLSPEVYSSNSLSAVGVAAHEAGHAIQHAKKYWPLVIRTSFYPVANIGSKLSYFLILMGFLFDAFSLLKIGIIFFAASVFFTLVTLPVEFNASSRALAMLRDNGIVVSGELDGCKKVLSAAALTYVAAALTAVLELLRLILMARRRN